MLPHHRKFILEEFSDKNVFSLPETISEVYLNTHPRFIKNGSCYAQLSPLVDVECDLSKLNRVFKILIKEDIINLPINTFTFDKLLSISGIGFIGWRRFFIFLIKYREANFERSIPINKEKI